MPAIVRTRPDMSSAFAAFSAVAVRNASSSGCGFHLFTRPVYDSCMPSPAGVPPASPAAAATAAAAAAAAAPCVCAGSSPSSMPTCACHASTSASDSARAATASRSSACTRSSSF
eukprot:6212175-Pleurochrysis_carterae.AAC.4